MCCKLIFLSYYWNWTRPSTGYNTLSKVALWKASLKQLQEIYQVTHIFNKEYFGWFSCLKRGGKKRGIFYGFGQQSFSYVFCLLSFIEVDGTIWPHRFSFIYNLWGPWKGPPGSWIPRQPCWIISHTLTILHCKSH